MQLDSSGHPEEYPNGEGAVNKETCIGECPSDYVRSGKYCLKNSCSHFLDEDLGKCVSDCGDKFIIGTNKCKSQCSNYYYINSSGKKVCLLDEQNCQNITPNQKFYFPGSQPIKCIDQCYITLENGLIKYLFYNPSNNECVESCLSITGKNYADEPKTTHQVCKDDCEEKYYYENEKICRDTPCILFKEDSADNKICVTECGTGQKVLVNKCVDSCTSNFFVEQIIEIKGEKRTIKKCVNDCLEYSSEYEFI